MCCAQTVDRDNPWIALHKAWIHVTSDDPWIVTEVTIHGLPAQSHDCATRKQGMDSSQTMDA